MKDIHVRDLVVNVGDRAVVGQVLSASESAGGLHSPADPSSGTPAASLDSVTPALCQCGGIPTTVCPMSGGKRRNSSRWSV